VGAGVVASLAVSLALRWNRRDLRCLLIPFSAMVVVGWFLGRSDAIPLGAKLGLFQWLVLAASPAQTSHSKRLPIGSPFQWLI
jgi:hypothetical protein